jgi:hypothetical protein
MMIKSYRGKLEDGGQDKIHLGTPNGKMGYRIVKFQLMPAQPGENNNEHTVKIYKTKQTTIDNTVDFTDNKLIAAAYLQEYLQGTNPSPITVMFDQEIFNQDIYVTAVDTNSTYAINYYIELEQVKLNESEALVSIVKNLRMEQ